MESTIPQMVGIASLLTLVSPIDLIRTRLQTDAQLFKTGRITQTYRSIRHCLKTIQKTEGVKSFWKGNTMNLARFFPNETINYKARSLLKPLFKS